MTFGKVIGGGLPVAAVGGPAAIMDQLAPLGPVYQAGTFSGNPVAVAAGLATLRLADDAVYARLDAVADALAARSARPSTPPGCRTGCSARGTCSRCSSAAAAAPASDYAGAQAQDDAAYTAFFHAMLDAGVALPPSAFEAWFVTAAHDDAAVEPHRRRPSRRPRAPRPPRPAPETETETETHETQQDRTHTQLGGRSLAPSPFSGGSAGQDRLRGDDVHPAGRRSPQRRAADGVAADVPAAVKCLSRWWWRHSA